MTQQNNNNDDIKVLDDRQFKEIVFLVLENKFDSDDILIEKISEKFELTPELSEKYLESIYEYLNTEHIF